MTDTNVSGSIDAGDAAAIPYNGQAVVVGHSLGSLVAYQVSSHPWGAVRDVQYRIQEEDREPPTSSTPSHSQPGTHKEGLPPARAAALPVSHPASSVGSTGLALPRVGGAA